VNSNHNPNPNQNKMKPKSKQSNAFSKFLNIIEHVGNSLPHPITLFAILALILVILSAILAIAGISAEGEVIDSKTMEVTRQTVNVVSLLDRKGLVYMLTHAVTNFTEFAPLGVVLVTMLGVGCAEGSGYLSALMKKAVSITPAAIVTPMLVFLGVMSNMASDVGYVVLIPLGAMVFMAYGRHPIAGIAAAFAGVSGGFSANLLIGTLDPMLAGISTEAAQLVSPGYLVEPSANWYFMSVSTFLIIGLGTYVTDKIVEPRLGKDWNQADESGEEAGSQSGDKQTRNIKQTGDQTSHLTNTEKKALRWGNITFLAIILLIAAAALPPNSFLRNEMTGSLLSGSPLMGGLIVLIALLFFIPSVVYGRISGTYGGEKDVCIQLGKNMEALGSYIALSFIAAQFINYFNYTNLGTILALKGAGFLEQLGAGGPVLMVLFIILSAVINLFMGSASAKWTILAPVFVPMFMLLGYSPELTQVAYRIGDSCTNLITPLMAYFSMVVVLTKKYDRNAGIGTLVSTMLPYSICFLIGWSVLLVVWMAIGLPLGPGAGLSV
jgi:aminobenzoyl-glutamate transport protein